MTATWRQSIVETHGACTNGDTDLQAWDLPDGGTAVTEENRLATRICRERCPVLAACARETLTAEEYPHGTIRAGVQLRRESIYDPSTLNHYDPSPRSLAQLRAVADGGDS